MSAHTLPSRAGRHFTCDACVAKLPVGTAIDSLDDDSVVACYHAVSRTTQSDRQRGRLKPAVHGRGRVKDPKREVKKCTAFRFVFTSLSPPHSEQFHVWPAQRMSADISNFRVRAVSRQASL